MLHDEEMEARVKKLHYFISSYATAPKISNSDRSNLGSFVMILRKN